MKNKLIILTLLSIFVISCDNDDETPSSIVQGDYPVKEYYIERDPSVNIWGAGMDLIHSECALEDTELDTTYLEEEDDFEYDLKFYVVKAYSYNGNGDLTSEGCPAILLASDVRAVQIGAGVSFFEDYDTITAETLTQLEYDFAINYDDYINDSTGFYMQDDLYAALDSCIIGQSFRSNILEIPEGSTEEEEQPVYLIETPEGGYAKFMVKQFKGDGAYKKQSLIMWQVISE